MKKYAYLRFQRFVKAKKNILVEILPIFLQVYCFLNIFLFLNTETARLYHKKYEFAFFYSDSAIQSLLFLWLAISYRCFWIHIITVFIVQNSLLLLLVHIKKLTLNKYIVAKYDKKN